MKTGSAAWKEAAWVFGLSRLVILLISALGIIFFPQHGQIASTNCFANPHACLLAWYHYDAVAYVGIAHHGYTYIPDTAFFPFWPLLEHAGGLLLGGFFPDSYYFAGLLFSNICFYFALVLLYRLLAEDFEESTARRALLYLAFSPYALFFFAGYTESLFLLLTLALFLVLRRGKPLDWWLAGLFGLLASATRSTGVILAIPFLVLYVWHFWMPAERASQISAGVGGSDRQGDRKGRPYPIRSSLRSTIGESERQGDRKGRPYHTRSVSQRLTGGGTTSHSWLARINGLLPVALIPMGIVAYMVFLYFTKGNPLLFASQEANFGWHRHLSLPWAGVFSDIGSLFSLHGASTGYVQNALDLTFTLIPLAVLAIGWRRLPLHYALFALGVALFTLAFPQGSEPLASLPRYMLILFPVTALLALWGKRERFHQVVLAFSLSLLALNIVLFILHYWVA